MSRLSKDQDTIDAELALIAFQLLVMFGCVIILHCCCWYWDTSKCLCSAVLGAVALVFYTFPYLGIIFVPLIVLYYLAALYYRRTSVEVKRLDSNLRSILYASYTGRL